MVAIPGFLWTNLADGLTPTGTSTSADAAYPWSRLNDPQPKRRAQVSATSLILVFDLGSAKDVNCAALISTTLPASATVRLRASTADPTCVASLLYDSGVQSTVTDPAWIGNVIATFATVNARYWRWDVTGSNPIAIGLAPIGKLFQPTAGFAYGAQEGRLDFSTRDRNDFGTTFGVAEATLRTRTVTFEVLAEGDVRQLSGNPSLDDIDRDVGASRALLFVPNPDEAAWITRARDSIWGTYRNVGDDMATRPTFVDVWQRTINILERL